MKLNNIKKYFKSPFFKGDVRPCLLAGGRTGGFRSGQGVVESVFAVGILVLLLGGAVILVILGISNQQNNFDRRKATELANVVTEELIARSQSSPEEFWRLTNSAIGSTKTNFKGYVYSIGFTNITGDSEYPNCGVGKTDCAEAVIGVGWSGKNPQTLYFNRFFSKNN